MGEFACSDDGLIALDYVYGLFDGEACPSLAGKPKLFFIDTCQGNETDFGVEVHKKTAAKGKSSFKTSENCSDNKERIPIKADQFVFKSSYDRFGSTFDHGKGSWFIQELCETIDKQFDKDDLDTISTRVKSSVAKKQDPWGFMQMPETRTTLRKKIKF